MYHMVFFVDSWFLIFQAMWYRKKDIRATPNIVRYVGSEFVTTFATQIKKVCDWFTYM